MTEFRAGHYQRAVQYCKSAIKIEPKLGPAWLFLGASYIKLGRPREALVPLRKVLEIQPDEAGAIQMLAHVELKSGNHREAVLRFGQLSKIRPDDPGVWDGLGWASKELSAEATTRLKNHEPDSPLLSALAGDRVFQLQKYRLAFYYYRKAGKRIELPGVHARLALVYAKTGHPRWAAVEKEKERRLSPPNCADHPLECLFAAGRYDDVIRSAKGSKSTDAYYWTAKAGNALVERVRHRLAELPPSPQSHTWAAQLYQERGLWRQAAAEWESVLKTFPGNVNLEYSVALSLYRANDFAAALPRLKKLLKRDPRSAELNYYCGTALLAMRRIKESAPYFRAAIREKPQFYLAHGALGRVYLKLGNSREAIPYLRKSLAIDTDGTFHYRLIRAYRNTGQMKLAKETLREYQKIRHTAKTRSKQPGINSPITAP